MFATASRVRGWLLIEVRGSWGEDAIHSSALGQHVPPHWKDELQRRHIRAVCIRAKRRSGTEGVRLFACAARRPGDGRAPLWRRDVESLAEVVGVAEDLHVDRAPDDHWERSDARVALVCTNGRHDQCCANRGRPVLRALEGSPWSDEVWECSHIGGDRFAANVVVLPDSLYFGRVESDSVASLFTTLDEGKLDLAFFRGRTSFSLAEQAAEYFLRRELGVDAVNGIVISATPADGSIEARVGDRAFSVRLRRHMVSVAEPLTCKGAPDQLVPSFTLESIT